LIYFLLVFEDDELLFELESELDLVVPLLLEEFDRDLTAGDELLEDVLPDLTEPELFPLLLEDLLSGETAV
jgi:hypothetical protein